MTEDLAHIGSDVKPLVDEGSRMAVILRYRNLSFQSAISKIW
jgi:hypothetical protein|tara:strand:- start:448 stop:573 length:126 start_codon:yes stop_codon:yes gene_type:complete